MTAGYQTPQLNLNLEGASRYDLSPPENLNISHIYVTTCILCIYLAVKLYWNLMLPRPSTLRNNYWIKYAYKDARWTIIDLDIQNVTETINNLFLNSRYVSCLLVLSNPQFWKRNYTLAYQLFHISQRGMVRHPWQMNLKHLEWEARFQLLSFYIKDRFDIVVFQLDI